jgi:hypothetical protein
MKDPRIEIWNAAIGILDRQSEPIIRDLIERELSGVAGVNHLRIGEAKRATAKLMQKIAPVRVEAIKNAFRYLRDHPEITKEKIKDASLAQWASGFAAADASRIETAIRSGLLGGFCNTDIAAQIVGQSNLNGCDGVTEITRKNISDLARQALKPVAAEAIDPAVSETNDDDGN